LRIFKLLYLILLSFLLFLVFAHTFSNRLVALINYFVELFVQILNFDSLCIDIFDFSFELCIIEHVLLCLLPDSTSIMVTLLNCLLQRFKLDSESVYFLL
jgi:hypothetical protein